MSHVADHLALLNLEARYAKAWDSSDPEGWAGVFTAGGTFEIVPVGDRAGLTVTGRAELSQFCAEFTRTTKGVHLPAVPLIEIDGDRATGHINFHFVAIARLDPAHSVSRTATGYYEVEYRKVDGQWLMDYRREKVLESSRQEFFDY